MRIDLSGRVAVVTGAAQGIPTPGRLAASGAAVLVADIPDEAGEAVAARIWSAGSVAAFAHADVAVEDDVARSLGREGG